MRTRTALLLAAAAGLLAACAGTTDGMERATSPAYATGEGLARSPAPATAEPAAASGHEHHAAQPDQAHHH